MEYCLVLALCLKSCPCWSRQTVYVTKTFPPAKVTLSCKQRDLTVRTTLLGAPMYFLYSVYYAILGGGRVSLSEIHETVYKQAFNNK